MEQAQAGRHRGVGWAVVVLVLGLLTTFYLAADLQRLNHQGAVQQLAARGDRLLQRIEERLRLFEYGLRGVRGSMLVAGDQYADYDSFRRYSLSRNINVEFPGAHGFGFIRRVPAAEEASFVAGMRASGLTDFRVRQLAPHGRERYIVQFVAPEARNDQAFGLDIASETHRRAAAERAMRTGQAQLTAPITLVQEDAAASQALLFLLPAYVGGATPATAAERIEKCIGWSYAPLVMTDLLDALAIDTHNVAVLLRDNVTSQAIYHSDQSAGAGRNDLTHTLVREVYGRQWQLLLTARPGYYALLNLGSPVALSVLGALISALLALLTYLGFAVRHRKLQAQLYQQSLAALVTNSPEAIVGLDTVGQITSWNARAEALFGFPFDEVAGRRLSDVLVPESQRRIELANMELLAKGREVASFECTRCRRDGTLVDVLVSVSPVYGNRGHVIGVTEVMRDITEEKRHKLLVEDSNVRLEAQVLARTRELETIHRRLQTVLDAVPSLVSYWSKDLVNWVANRAYARAVGQPLERLQGQPLADIDASDLLHQQRKKVLAALDGAPQHFERSVVDSWGEPQYLQTDLVPDVVEGMVSGVFIIEHDITEITKNRLHLAEALHENEVLLSTIDTQLLLSVTDPQGKILEVNDNFCRATGYREAELVGRDHKMLNSGVHAPAFMETLWATIARGESWRGEMCNRTHSGEARWYDMVISPFVGANGEIERYVSLSSDVTARKQADVELKRLNTLLTQVLDAATDMAIVVTSAEGRVRLFNSGAERMLGYSAKSIKDRLLPIDLFDADEIAAQCRLLGLAEQPDNSFAAVVARASAEGTDTREWQLTSSGGRTFLASVVLTKLQSVDGELEGFLAIARDISAQREHERALLSARDQLRIAAEVSNLGVWSWELATNALTWNDRMLELYGYPPTLREDEAINYEHWRSRVHPEDVAFAETKLMGALANTDVYDPVFRVVSGTTTRYIQAAAQVERDDKGEAVRVTGINLDVTEQRELEERLRQAKMQADATSAAKSAFMANMSHEIRTPMNAIMGMLQLIQQTPLNNHQQDYVVKAHRAAKSLLGILNDILDFSKLDAKKMSLDEHPFEVEGLLRDLASVLVGSTTENDIEVIFDVDANIPNTLRGDKQRLHQVLINLAGNALKFTEKGQVVVGIKLVSQAPHQVSLCFYVQDTGIGISTEQQTRIFNSFEQAETSTTRRFGGTGLGLVISRELVALMGAELKLESHLGEGSRFWFEVQFPVANPEPLVNVVEAALTGLHLLVVEDNRFMSEVLAATLTTLDWQVDQAYDGDEAVSMVQAKHDLGMAYDVILMDWRMPKMDGVSAAAAIKAIYDEAPPVIIMVSAYSREELTKQAGKAHFADYLLKPVTPVQILDCVGRAMGLTQYQLPARQPQSQPLAGLYLLLVEDNPLNQQVAQEMLAGAGAKVDLASGGLEGVAKVLDAEHSYDLVLMDIQMPDIDGLEACRRIRADGRFAALPILAMTANAADDDRRRCLAAGMNDHIGKPIDLAELTARILRLTETGQNTSAPQSMAPVAPATEPLAGAALTEPGELIDPMRKTLGRFSGKVALYRRMLEQLRPELDRLMAELSDQLAQQDYPGASRTAHSIKGVSATMGARALSAQVSTLEGKLKDSATPLSEETAEGYLSELTQLTRDSVSQLHLAIDELQVSEEQRSGLTKKRSSDDWFAHMQLLIKQLQERNLQALDDIHLLLDQPPGRLAEQVTTLANLVEAMEFERALQLATHLLEEERWKVQ